MAFSKSHFLERIFGFPREFETAEVYRRLTVIVATFARKKAAQQEKRKRSTQKAQNFGFINSVDKPKILFHVPTDGAPQFL